MYFHPLHDLRNRLNHTPSHDKTSLFFNRWSENISGTNDAVCVLVLEKDLFPASVWTAGLSLQQQKLNVENLSSEFNKCRKTKTQIQLNEIRPDGNLYFWNILHQIQQVWC